MTSETPTSTPPAPSATPPTQPSWRDSLSPEFKEHQALKDYPDLNSLAKSHVHLQSKLGANPIVRPKDDAKPEEFQAFYDSLGRPKTAQDYKLPDVKLPDGLPKDEAFTKAFLSHFHEAGLTQKQAEHLYSKYMEHSQSSFKAFNEQKALQRQEGLQKLQTEWKNDFDKNVNVAKVALRTFGDEALVKWLDDTGLGDNPALINFFHRIGTSLLEDKASGEGAGGFVGDGEKAQAELNNLMADKDFSEAYNNSANLKHHEAVDKVLALNRRILGGKNKTVQPS